MAAWLPSDIAGLIGWFDPSDSTTHTSSGGRLTQLDDKSGNGHHLTAASMGPLLTTVNGLTALNTDQRPLVGPSSLISVIPNSATFVAADTGGFSSSRALLYVSGTVYRIFQNFSNQVDLDGGTGVASAFIDGLHVFGLVRPLPGTWEAFQDGVSIYSNTSTSASVTFRVGASSATGSGKWEPPIGDVVVTPSDISADDRQKLEGYLAHKWGVEAKLPSGHPYKAAPPTTSSPVTHMIGGETESAYLIGGETAAAFYIGDEQMFP